MINLSVLICHEKKREIFLSRLKLNLLVASLTSLKTKNVDVFDYLASSQVNYSILPIGKKMFAEVIVDDTEGITIGEKRNILMSKATGEYVVFIDDDDLISPNYFKHICEGIEKGVDCCSLTGKYFLNGNYKNTFIHSLEFDIYSEHNGTLRRPPNHLNVLKTSKVKKFKFKSINDGEDTDWAMQICEAKVLEVEHKIDDVLYFYEKLNYEPDFTKRADDSGYGSRFN